MQDVVEEKEERGISSVIISQHTLLFFASHVIRDLLLAQRLEWVFCIYALSPSAGVGTSMC